MFLFFFHADGTEQGVVIVLNSVVRRVDRYPDVPEPAVGGKLRLYLPGGSQPGNIVVEMEYYPRDLRVAFKE